MVRLFKIDIESRDRLFLWVPAVNKVKLQVSQFPVSNSQFPIPNFQAVENWTCLFYRVSYGGGGPYSCELLVFVSARFDLELLLYL